MPLISDASPFDVEGRGGHDDRRLGVVRADRVEDGVDAGLVGAVHLVHDADVRHAQVRLAGVVAKLVARPVGIDDDEVQVGLHERRVVVASVPHDHVGLLLGGFQDRGIVDARKDEVPLGDVRLVLLALLDRAVGCLEVLVAREALDNLLREVAVGHRVPENGHALPVVSQELSDPAGGLALPRARPDGADRDRGLRGGQRRVVRGEQAELRAGGEREGARVHHVLVGHVGVREDDLVHLVLANQVCELGLGSDRDPVRVEVTGQEWGIDAAGDVRNLCRREGNDVVVLAAAVHDVEIVKVASGRTCDENSFGLHEYELCSYTADGAR